MNLFTVAGAIFLVRVIARVIWANRYGDLESGAEVGEQVQMNEHSLTPGASLGPRRSFFFPTLCLVFVRFFPFLFPHAHVQAHPLPGMAGYLITSTFNSVGSLGADGHQHVWSVASSRADSAFPGFPNLWPLSRRLAPSCRCYFLAPLYRPLASATASSAQGMHTKKRKRWVDWNEQTDYCAFFCIYGCHRLLRSLPPKRV
jgi:hypothetical protein